MASGANGSRTAATKPIINIENHDTISMLALEADGRLPADAATSGIACKLHGRVGALAVQPPTRSGLRSSARRPPDSVDRDGLNAGDRPRTGATRAFFACAASNRPKTRYTPFSRR